MSLNELLSAHELSVSPDDELSLGGVDDLPGERLGLGTLDHLTLLCQHNFSGWQLVGRQGRPLLLNYLLTCSVGLRRNGGGRSWD